MSDIVKELNWRYATKEFDPTKKVSPEDINTLLESLRLSPSSFGLQPWKFVVVENKEIKEELVAHSYNQQQVAQCSHLLVLCTPTDATEEHIDNFMDDMAKTQNVSKESLAQYEGYMKGFLTSKSLEEKITWMDKQLYIAFGVLLTAAARLHIDTCPIEGFSAPDYDKKLNLTEQGLRSVAVCPIGYRADSDKYSAMPKVRYSQEQVVSWVK